MLASAIRDTAVSNKLVGKNLMAVSLPRGSLNLGGGFSVPLTDSIPSNECVSLYLPGSETKPIIYQPNYTCNGMSFKRGWTDTGGSDTEVFP